MGEKVYTATTPVVNDTSETLSTIHEERAVNHG